MSEYTNESASILNLAQKVHDDYVTEGKNKADSLIFEAQEVAERLVSEASAEAESLRTEATNEANRVLSEAESDAREIVESAEAEAAELESRIKNLKRIEYEYRARLSDLANNALKSLEASTEEHSDTNGFVSPI